MLELLGSAPAHVTQQYKVHGCPSYKVTKQMLHSSTADGSLAIPHQSNRSPPPHAHEHQDFESYYADVSAAISSDEYFCLQVQACWGLGPAAAACAVSTTAAHLAAATTAAAGENTVRLSGDYDPAYTRRTYSKARTSAPPGVLPGTAERGSKAKAAGRAGSRNAGRTPTAGVAAILKKMGAEVQGHGSAWGLAGLRRALFDADRYVLYTQ